MEITMVLMTIKKKNTAFAIFKSHLSCRYKFARQAGRGSALDRGVDFSRENLQNFNSKQASHKQGPR